MTGVLRPWEGPCRLATATGVAALLLCGAAQGGEWLLGTDPQDVGRGGQWFRSPRPEAKRTRVPWIIQDYSSGLMVAVHELGAGRFILNTMRVREELGRHPAAERLLRNLLRYAARDAGKPLADLPAGFDAALKTLGYQ